MKRLHRALAVVGVAASTAALSACSYLSPIQTDAPYNPSDGVSAKLGVVVARNLAIVSSAANGKGVLTGAVVNQGDSSVSVSFADAQSTEAGQMSLGGRELKPISTVVFNSVAAAPGATTDILVHTSEGATQKVTVPVILPTGSYATIAP